MNKKQVVKFISFIVICLMLILPSMVSYATVETGSINFFAVENETKENISNLSVNIYQIGVKNEQGDFEYSAGFEGSNLDIDTLTEENINTIKEYAIQNAEPIETKVTDSNGEFTISNLQEGAYLFVQASNTDEYTMQTMLVQIPEIDTDGNSNYTITAKPKIERISQEELEAENSVADTSTLSSTQSTLPYTGVLNWPVPVLVVVAIVLFCIGWIRLYINSKKKSKLGIILMIIATIVIIVAIGLLVYNNIEENRVRDENESIVSELESNMDQYTDLDNENDLSWLDYGDSVGADYSITIDGITYIGILYFPSIENLAIPVIDDCSDSLLKISSCRYSGSLKGNDMIIAGHSYKAIFGKLNSNLVVGDLIYFKDLTGTVYKYKLSSIETLYPSDVEKMQEGDWDLTLFTCSYDNQKRMTYRFDLTD